MTVMTATFTFYNSFISLTRFIYSPNFSQIFQFQFSWQVFFSMFTVTCTGFLVWTEWSAWMPKSQIFFSSFSSTWHLQDFCTISNDSLFILNHICSNTLLEWIYVHLYDWKFNLCLIISIIIGVVTNIFSHHTINQKSLLIWDPNY